MSGSYQQTLEYLYTNLPMFQRVGSSAYKKDLTNTVKLCDILGNPQHSFKSVHIAGTNGKGSTSHMLASVLQSAGYKTGLYTSPHLKEFTERIKINGQDIDHGYVVDFVNRIKPHIDDIRPSFFEITVAMAFDFFAKQQVDIAVIEVGLGGRLDSTNVITPIVSVITNIGYDHKDILGDTLESIASEKAGIIKRHVPVVISERQEEIENVFINKAGSVHAPIYFAEDQFRISQGSKGLDVFLDDKLHFSGLSLPLKGNYQSKNLAGVLKACEILRSNGGFSITDETIVQGLERTVIQTGLKGRWQQLGEYPLMICDTGHNVDGIQEVVKQISQQKFNKLHMVWGMVRDKEPDAVLSMLPTQAHYYFCQATIPRALDANQLSALAKKYNLIGEVFPSVQSAIKKAKESAEADDFIFIGGSTFVVAEIENL